MFSYVNILGLEKDKWKVILGRSGDEQHSHKLAAEYITSGRTVNYKIINDILAYCNIEITEDKLKELINAPSFILEDLCKGETNKNLTDKIGTPSSKIQIAGVYIFKHKYTGQKYVGSSSQLAIRLFGYLNFRQKLIGKFVPFPCCCRLQGKVEGPLKHSVKCFRGPHTL